MSKQENRQGQRSQNGELALVKHTSTDQPLEVARAHTQMDPVTDIEHDLKYLALVDQNARLRDQLRVMMDQARLGLVWERDLLEPEVTGEDKAILLDLINEEGGLRLSNPENDPGNLLIEGDNLDALRLLSKTHKGKIDCIFIDPPYNTGNTTFIYNDRFVNKDHRWRKSLWLEFLHKRLMLARDLLSPGGVLLVAINDEHRSLLELLLEEIMPGKRKGSLVWKTRSGSNDDVIANLTVDHEHILVYANANFRFLGEDKDFSVYKNPDNDPRGRWTTGDLSKPHSWKKRPNTYYPLQNPETGVWYPCVPQRVWAFASEDRVTEQERRKLRSETMEEYIRRGKVIFPDPGKERVEVFSTHEELMEAIALGNVPVRPKAKTPLLTDDLPDLDFWVGKPIGFDRPWFKRHLRDVKRDIRPVSSWIRGATEEPDDDHIIDMVAQRSGTGDDSVNEMLGGSVFEYPKPVSLMASLINHTTKPDSIVLDFFAGSASTAHGVLRANANDGGSRRFIMVSSTEATVKEPAKNVARDVAAVRISKAMKGYKKGIVDIPGLGGGFSYLRARRVSHSSLRRSLTDIHVWTLLCLREKHPVTHPVVENGIAVQEAAASVLIWCPEPEDSSIQPIRDLIGHHASGKPIRVYTGIPSVMREALEGLGAEIIDDLHTARAIAGSLS